MIAVLISYAIGMLACDWLWRRKIKEKATLGFRLEVDGKLYSVVRIKNARKD